MRARRSVMSYFSLSGFVRPNASYKTPDALGARFDVTLEQEKVTNAGQNATNSTPGQRVASFSVDTESQGRSASDALEKLALMYVPRFALQPPACMRPCVTDDLPRIHARTQVRAPARALRKGRAPAQPLAAGAARAHLRQGHPGGNDAE